MNAAAELAFALGIETAGIVDPLEFHIQPATGGTVLDNERDWIVVTTSENKRIAGPLWRGIVEVQIHSRALTDPPNPAEHREAAEAVLSHFEDEAALKLSFDGFCDECALNGIFIDSAPPPQMDNQRWVSSVRVVCGFGRI